ncbi:hypothetical protein M9435_004459 [Picochlorum sp. BPE23]|nr:hypothetical protein M9435_004459 [Picochlorum sp. BPE23]
MTQGNTRKRAKYGFVTKEHHDPCSSERESSVEHMPGSEGDSIRRQVCQRPKARWRAECGDADGSIVATTIPSFRPTEEEWENPMEYISGITEEASRWGMAHIIPPESWKPPFAIEQNSDGVDLDTFEFAVKRQPTSELCCRDAQEGFGFAPLKISCRLKEFSEYADWAKAMHFSCPEPTGTGVSSEDAQRPVHLFPNKFPMKVSPSVEEIEREFWRIVDSGSEHVEALYGSDLDNGCHGSGFPLPAWRRELLHHYFREHRGVDIVPKEEVDDTEESYRNHPWNINNMPCSPGSLLHYLKEDAGLVSGVMVPWVYAGSCFSSFCWHIEDHALYSVNYIHFGSPKVWYAVPSDASREFEEAMQDALPHLFEASPSLLYQLVTQIHPRELIKRGVPVYRVVHPPRTFVVTMPNAYHSGFNTGFNCAEAVNFAAPPWLRYGSAIVRKYQKSRKPVTISQDALLCKLVSVNCDEHAGMSDVILQAACELHLRLQEIQEDWKTAKVEFSKLGVDLDSIPKLCQKDGSGVSTKEADCAVCNRDLWLFGLYSIENDEDKMCLNHGHLLLSHRQYSSDSICFSYQLKIEELESMVSRIMEAHEGSNEILKDLQCFHAGQEPKVQKCGPLYKANGVRYVCANSHALMNK